jgi:hypothetical protein
MHFYFIILLVTVLLTVDIQSSYNSRGVRTVIGNNSSWHTVEAETLGDGEEFITKEVKAAMAANLAKGQARETSLRSSEDLAMNIV